MDWRLQSQEHIKALVLVAHPDDETIFCGGTMLRNPDWEWAVVCVTMQLSTPRLQEFRHAMDMFRGYGVNITSNQTLEQKDEGQELSAEEAEVWKVKIRDLPQAPDIVFTHNTEGEYGHPHHRSLNRIVHELFQNVWEFICPGAVNVTPQPFKATSNLMPLSQDILNKKTEIFNRSYTTQLNCWRELPDIMQYEFRTGPEIFTSD